MYKSASNIMKITLNKSEFVIVLTSNRVNKKIRDTTAEDILLRGFERIMYTMAKIYPKESATPEM